MKNIYVVTDNHKGIIGAYGSKQSADAAVEAYEDTTYASVEARGAYNEDYPNGEISYAEWLIQSGDYGVECVEYKGD